MNREQFYEKFPARFTSVDQFMEESGFLEEGLDESETRYANKTVLPTLGKGAAWLLEPFRDMLPNTHTALVKADACVVATMKSGTSVSPVKPRYVTTSTFLVYANNVACLEPRAFSHLPEGGAPGSLMIEHSVLPVWLARSWYWRALAWQRKCVDDPAPGSYPRELPSRSAWGNMEWLMHDRRPAYRRKIAAAYRDFFGESDWIAEFGQPSMCVFIDSACPVLGQPEVHGHQILVHVSRTDGRLYHVIDRDFANLREIDAMLAQEAMDNYFVTALFGDPTEFDFSKYSRPVFQVNV